jgi:hypothetical protein
VATSNWSPKGQCFFSLHLSRRPKPTGRSNLVIFHNTQVCSNDPHYNYTKGIPSIPGLSDSNF